VVPALEEIGIVDLVRRVVAAIVVETATLIGVTTGVVTVGSAAIVMTGVATGTIIGVATRATSARMISVGA
jgi:hypothetical protein